MMPGSSLRLMNHFFLILDDFQNSYVTLNINISITKCGVYDVRFFTQIDKPFFLILDNFQNAYLTLNIHISAKWQPEIKINVPKFKLAHWEVEHFLILKISLLLRILCLIKQEYFFGSPCGIGILCANVDELLPDLCILFSKIGQVISKFQVIPK